MVRAEVIAPVSVNNAPANVGDVVEVDENTFANLHRKGRLKHAEAPKSGIESAVEYVEGVKDAIAGHPKRNRPKKAKTGKKFKGFR